MADDIIIPGLLKPLPNNGHTVSRAFYDPASRDPQTTFPLDASTDISQLSDETLINLLKTAPVLYRCSGTHIVRLSSTLIMKGEQLTRPCEPSIMDLVRTKSSIPVPKVHRVVHIGKKDSYYGDQCLFVMDFIEGRTIEEIWEEASDTQRDEIVLQVANMIKELESATVPQDPGPVDCPTSLWLGRWFTHFGAGPFANIAAMEAWFNRKLALCQALKQAPESVPPFRFGKLVLTNNDIAPRNLLLGGDGKTRSQTPLFTDLLVAKIQRHDAFAWQLQSINYGLTTAAFIQ
ncbi:hypothetical protein BJX99DRAFT_269914 [Aspergillus californicus]